MTSSDTSLAASPAMGERIAAACARGDLPAAAGAPRGAAAIPEVRLLGTGETFAAWRIGPARGAALTLRLPWRALDPAMAARSLEREAAALDVLPPGVGPRLIALHPRAGTSPLGLPCILTTHVPGRVLAPERWTAAHLRAHADLVARLHNRSLPARGPVDAVPAADPPRPFSILADAEQALGALRAEHPAVLARDGLPDLVAAALRVCAAADPACGRIGDEDGWVLAHGDLSATNVLWRTAPGGAPLPDLIDLEWAQADDRARDLAIIGGAVHGGPWYVPMDERAIEAFLDAYLERTRALRPDLVIDPRALRIRRRGWEAYERTAMTLHVAARAAEGSALHARVLPGLRRLLERRLAELTG